MVLERMMKGEQEGQVVHYVRQLVGDSDLVLLFFLLPVFLLLGC